MNFDLTHVWDSPHSHVLLVPPAQKFANKTFVEGGNTMKFAKVPTRESFRLYGSENLACLDVQASETCLQAQTLLKR